MFLEIIGGNDVIVYVVIGYLVLNIDWRIVL